MSLRTIPICSLEMFLTFAYIPPLDYLVKAYFQRWGPRWEEGKNTNMQVAEQRPEPCPHRDAFPLPTLSQSK